MGDGKGDSSGENGWPDFDHGGEAGVGPDEPEGKEEIERREKDGGGAGEREEIEAGDAVESEDGNAHGSECDGSRVCHESESRRLQRMETEADEDGCADGDGRAETGGAFKERAESEGDEEKLQAAVGGDAGEALLEGDEAAGLDGEVVKEDDGKDDPADGEEAVARAVRGGGEGETRGHVKEDDGGEQRGDETGNGGDVRFDAEDGHGAEEHHDGKSGDERGELPETGRVVALRPVRAGGVGDEEVGQAEKQREEGRGFKGEGCGVEGAGAGSGAE